MVRMGEITSRPATILLVEDDTLTRTALVFLLTTAGYQVLEASDGVEGVECFTQQPGAIDLVVSDLFMPRMDGLEMLQALQAYAPQVKLILLTGAPPKERAWRAQGVQDWLSKSLAPEQLLNKVAAALADCP